MPRTRVVPHPSADPPTGDAAAPARWRRATRVGVRRRGPDETHPAGGMDRRTRAPAAACAFAIREGPSHRDRYRMPHIGPVGYARSPPPRGFAAHAEASSRRTRRTDVARQQRTHETGEQTPRRAKAVVPKEVELPTTGLLGHSERQHVFSPQQSGHLGQHDVKYGWPPELNSAEFGRDPTDGRGVFGRQAGHPTRLPRAQYGEKATCFSASSGRVRAHLKRSYGRRTHAPSIVRQRLGKLRSALAGPPQRRRRTTLRPHTDHVGNSAFGGPGSQIVTVPVSSSIGGSVQGTTPRQFLSGQGRASVSHDSRNGPGKWARRAREMGARTGAEPAYSDTVTNLRLFFLSPEGDLLLHQHQDLPDFSQSRPARNLRGSSGHRAIHERHQRIDHSDGIMT